MGRGLVSTRDYAATWLDLADAGLLDSPGGAAIAQVVQSALPFPAGAEAVLIEAIEIAAKKQTNGQVVGTLAVGVVVTLILWGLFRR